MRVSVVIPALNEGSLIADCVERAWRAKADEVIVVDGSSADTTRQLAEQAGARVMIAAKGRATQQNAGATLATGDILLFVHADCTLGRHCISQIRTTMTSSEFGYGCFRQRIMAKGVKYRALELGNDLRARVLQMPYGDQGIFIRKDLFDEIGGFAEFRLMEDAIIANELRRRTRPAILQGPIQVDARRWEKHGVVQQTFRNLLLTFAWRMGVHPDRLAKYYESHCKAPIHQLPKTESAASNASN